MASRLRKIFLIDGKTSGTLSSGMICHIDLRGGAAITGANGVGKTTSLQLLGLFFGGLASRIVPAKGAIKPMLEFVLPHETSAVAFEYQRGNKASDIRFVTIRRRRDGAIDYRFFQGELKEELFVQPNEEGVLQLLDDAGTVKIANQLGIQFEQKLQVPDYRNVIRGTRTHNKDGQLVNRLIMTYSFARRPLPHIDKLLEAIIKDTVDFRDLNTVVEAMVFERIGSMSHSGSKLQIKPMGAQMQWWQVNVQACYKAEAKKPEVESLRAAVRANGLHRISIRTLRADVQALLEIVRGKKTSAQESLAILQASRSDVIRIEQEALAEYEGRHETLKAEVARIKQSISELEGSRDYFTREQAEYWVGQVKELPQLTEQISQMERQIGITRSAAADIARQIEEEISEVRVAASEQQGRIEASRAVPNKQFDDELKKLEAATKVQNAEKEAQHREESAEIEAVLQELRDQVAAARAQVNSPSDAPDAIERLAALEATYEQVSSEASSARKAASQAKTALYEAKTEFAAAQGAESGAERHVAQSRAALEEAKLRHTPQPGSLLATLQSGDPETWQGTLARVINPELLVRSDLNPSVQPDAAAGIYGWSFDLDAIAVPAWADPQVMERDVGEKTQALSAANGVLERARLATEAAGKKHKAADDSFNVAEATVNIAEQNVARQQGHVRECKEEIKRARNERVRDAQQRLDAVTAQVTAAERRKNDVVTRHRRELNAIIAAAEQRREQLRTEKDDALRVIDEQKVAHKEVSDKQERELRNERERRLREGGVDVEKLNALEMEFTALKARVRERESRRPLVDQWDEWKKSGGDNKLVDCQRQRDETTSAMSRVAANIQAHKAGMGETKRKYDDNEARLNKIVAASDLDIQMLERDNQRLSDFPPSPRSVVNESTEATQLNGYVTRAINENDEQLHRIKAATQKLEAELTQGKNQVSDLITGYLEQPDHGDRNRATLLCDAYDLIPRQIVVQLNREQGSILESLQSIATRVRLYQSVVAELNKVLQEGLTAATMGFERIKRFELEIVTTFGNLPFMPQLDSLSTAVAEHRNNAWMQANTSLPSRSTVDLIGSVVSAIGDSSVEIDLSRFMTFKGKVDDGGNLKTFANEDEIRNISSTGLTALIKTVLIAAMANMIRGTDDIYLPWATDEVGKYDADNFGHLMDLMKAQKIDIITASPQLDSGAYMHFKNRYLFQPQSEWSVFQGTEEEMEKINAEARAQAEAEQQLEGAEQ